MGVMFGGGWPGRLPSGGMIGGGDGVAKDREAELSEARESWPESHMITAMSLAPQRLEPHVLSPRPARLDWKLTRHDLG